MLRAQRNDEYTHLQKQKGLIEAWIVLSDKETTGAQKLSMFTVEQRDSVIATKERYYMKTNKRQGLWYVTESKQQL